MLAFPLLSIGTSPVFSDLPKRNIHSFDISSASFFKALGCQLCRPADLICYLTFSWFTAGMNNIALSSYDRTDFFSDFSSNRDWIYLQNIQIFTYIIDVAILLCSQDQKSFLLSLTLMKKLTFCFHPYQFSVVLIFCLILMTSNKCLFLHNYFDLHSCFHFYASQHLG